MKKEDVGSVPVVESLSSKRLIGIVTDRDLVTKVVAGGRAVDQATARDAMTSNPASCAEDDEVSDAMTLMAQRQVRRMPVSMRKARHRDHRPGRRRDPHAERHRYRADGRVHFREAAQR